MDIHKLNALTDEEKAAHNRAALEKMVSFKLGEIDDLMDLPEGLYAYPFSGMTHEARQKELVAYLREVAESMGVEAFMRTPTIHTVGCIFAAQHRGEPEKLLEMLKVLNIAFMSAYAIPEASNDAASAFNLLMSVIDRLADEDDVKAPDGESGTGGHPSPHSGYSIH